MIRRTLIVWICLLAFSAACCAESGSQEEPGLKSVRLQLKWRKQFQFAGYYAAKALGYYAEAGLDVEIIEGTPGVPASEKVKRGDAEYGVDGVPNLMRLKAEGFAPSILGVIFQHSPYAIISVSENGIRTPADLAGARLMLGDYLEGLQLVFMMEREGIPRDSATFLPHSYNYLDLIEGKVDGMVGYITSQPYDIRKAGYEPMLLRPLDYGVDFYGDAMFALQSYVSANPEEARAFRDASIRGWEWAFENVDSAIDILLALPSDSPPLTREFLEFEARKTRDLARPDVIEVGHVNPHRLERMAKLYIDEGFLPADYNVEGVIFHVPEPNWRDKLIWIGALSAFFLAIIGVIAFVNAELRKKVAEKTESLETEIVIRKAHEEALQKQENFLSTMAQTVPGIIVVLDLERMIPTYLNRDISPLDIDWDDVEKRGEDVVDLFCPPEERERVRAFYKGMRDAGVGESREIDHRCADEEGKDRWLHIGARPLERDDNGEVASVVLAITDITELKRINRELDEQKRLLEKIAKTLPDLIYIFDYNERRYVYTNRPPRIEGKPDGVSGSSFINMIAAPEDRERAEAFIASLRDADDEGVYEFEHRALNEEGERRWIFSVNRVFARNERGEVTQLVGTARDITELKRATEELERANERLSEANATKDKLFSIVAHDLRGPFNGLIGYTDYLTGIDPSDCPEEIKRVAKKLNEEALATFRLLDNLLQWSRLQSGRLEFSPESFSFVEAVECAVAAARSQAKSKNVSLTSYVEPSIKTYADPFAVETIVRNLYSNAIKFSDAGASVLTRAEERGEFVVVEIADEGVGMTPEQLEALFDLGSGVSRRGTAGEKGTGLGLTLCKEFVERSGGTIEVESVLGVGSVFRFTLPRG